MIRKKKKQFQFKPAIFGSGLFFIALISLSVGAKPVRADGGKTKECRDASIRSYQSGNDSQITYNAPEDKVISGVCIKSGVNMFGDSHSGPLGNGTYEDGCYLVEGAGTGSLAVKKLKDGPDCQDISHLDIYLSFQLTPTPTKSAEPTSTPTDNPEPTPTDQPEDNGDDSACHECEAGSNESGKVLGVSTTVLASTGASDLKISGLGSILVFLQLLVGFFLRQVNSSP
jgi:hypothetical protein